MDSKPKRSQEIQDEIFRQMTVDKKIRLASDFSSFILNLNKPGKAEDGFSGISRKTRKNSHRP